MKAQEFRDMSIEDLNKKLTEMRKEQFNLKMQKGVGTLAKPQVLQEIKKNIARLKTVLHEKTTGQSS